MNNNIGLGSTWPEISARISSEFPTADQFAASLKLCLLHELRDRLALREEDKIAVLKEYENTFRKH